LSIPGLEGELDERAVARAFHVAESHVSACGSIRAGT